MIKEYYNKMLEDKYPWFFFRDYKWYKYIISILLEFIILHLHVWNGGITKKKARGWVKSLVIARLERIHV